MAEDFSSYGQDVFIPVSVTPENAIHWWQNMGTS